MFKLAGNACTFDSKYGEIVTLGCATVLFQNLIFWALTFAGIVALVLLIVGGIKYITSGGDAKAADGAKKTITWALIGLVVILMSFAVLSLIAGITGVKCITKFGFNSCGSTNSAPAQTTKVRNGRGTQ